MSYVRVYPPLSVAPPTGVDIPIRLTRIAATTDDVASFGVPFARDMVTSTRQLAIDGRSIKVTPTLFWYNEDGVPTSIQAVRIQLTMSSSPLDITLQTGQAGSVDWPLASTPFSAVSRAVTHTVPTGTYTITYTGGVYQFTTSGHQDRALFDTREPCVYAAFEADYLASSGLFGYHFLSQQDVASEPTLAGVKYLSDAFGPCALSGAYQSSWRMNNNDVPATLPIEGYLYDRAATFALAYGHTNDPVLAALFYRYAWHYGSLIKLDAPLRGIWQGNTDNDTKYSHARGLYYYLALTGDENATTQLDAIADLWQDEFETSAPYQLGTLRGWDKIWTERELSVALEACLFGFYATGQMLYFDSVKALVDTAYLHISTQDQATLDTITKPYVSGGITYHWPPQNAFVHSGGQQGESLFTNPWVSSWMTELMVATLLVYQEQTDDVRIDEIFVRLGRFLRDTGCAYTYTPGAYAEDTFLNPSKDYTTPGSRRLFAWYGSGRYMNQARYTRYNSDIEHAPDTTALTAMAQRGLARRPSLDAGAMAPFASERACFEAMHHELSYTSRGAIATRDYGAYYRDPSRPTGTFHTQTRLAAKYAEGADAIAAYVRLYHVGGPRYGMDPERKLSWWFNNSVLQFGLMRDEGEFSLPTIIQGWVAVSDQTQPLVLEDVTASTNLTALMAAWKAQAASLSLTTWFPTAIAVGDFTGSGRPDIVYAHHSELGTRIFTCVGYNINGVPQFADYTTARTLTGTGLTFYNCGADGSPYILDWNNDGYPDILFPGDESPGTRLALNNGSGSFTISANSSIDSCQLRLAQNPTTGYADVIGIYSQYWPFYAYRNDGGGTYTRLTAKTHGEWGEFTTAMRLRPEMQREGVVTFADASGTLRVVWPDHRVRLARIVRFRAGSGGVLPTGLAPDTDYWVVEPRSATAYFSVAASYPGSAITFTDAGTGPIECYYDLERPTVRTVDLGPAIGTVSLVSFGQASSQSPDRYSFAIQGDDISGWTDVTAAIGLPANHAFFVAGVFDFNQDGLLDLLLTDCATGGVYINTGAGVLTRHEDELSADIAAHTYEPGTVTLSDLADFDEDGVPELLLQHGRYGTVSRLYQNVNGAYVRAFTFPIKSQQFVVTDFNADGRLDIAACVGQDSTEGPHLRIWLNRTVTENKCVNVKLTGPANNLMAIDAVVRAYTYGHVGDVNYLLTTVVNNTSGSPAHLSLNGVGHSHGGNRPIHLGLGGVTHIAIRASFPTGEQVDALDVWAAGQTVNMVVT